MYPRFLQFGAFVISTYGVLAVVAALCGIALWTAIARRTALDATRIQNAGLIAVACAVVGARLAVVVANWRGFLEAPLLIFAAGTLSTGSAAWFGVLLAVIAALVYLLLVRMPLVPALAAVAPAVVLALAVLDIGDFAAGSHYGAPTAAPWGVTYTSRFAARTTGVPLGVALHPVQVYAAIGHFVLAGVLVVMLRRQMQHDGGRLAEVLGTALFADGVMRFLLTPLSGAYADAPVLFHVVTPAQALAMLMVVVGGVCWLGRGRQPAVHHA
jgi:phosphatidylglycerol---prolipoprotein diacylglyceryl transferase